MESQEKANKLISFWNTALTMGAANILGGDAPYVFMEVARVALEKLREEGIELIKETPVETINAVYDYFHQYGYFREAWARASDRAPAEECVGVVRMYEKWIDEFHSCCWAQRNDRLCTYACFCYNLIRYCLVSGFGLDLRFVDSELNKDTRELYIEADLVAAEKELMNTLRLMTELNKHRSGLQKVSGNFKRAVEMSLDAVISVDEAGLILLWNPAAEKLFGWSAQEVLGGPVEIIIPEEQRVAHKRGMARYVSSGEARLIGTVTEQEAIRKDGSRLPVELSLSAESVEGGWVFTGVIRDVSIRKSLEGELKLRLIEMERLNKLMVGRELKMEELRKEIRELRSRLAG